MTLVARAIAAVAAAIMVATVASPASAAPISDAQLAEAVRRYNATLPRNMGRGVWLTAVTVQGRRLVMRVSGFPDWRATGQEARVKQVFDPLCNERGMRMLIDAGVAVTIAATSPAGAELPMIRLCELVR